MLDVLKLERPVKWDGVATTRFDMSENGETLFIPAKFPCEHRRKRYNQKAIGKVGNAMELGLKTALESPVTQVSK